MWAGARDGRSWDRYASTPDPMAHSLVPLCYAVMTARSITLRPRASALCPPWSVVVLIWGFGCQGAPPPPPHSTPHGRFQVSGFVLKPFPAPWGVGRSRILWETGIFPGTPNLLTPHAIIENATPPARCGGRFPPLGTYPRRYLPP